MFEKLAASRKEADAYIVFCKKLIEAADIYLFPDKLL